MFYDTTEVGTTDAIAVTGAGKVAVFAPLRLPLTQGSAAPDTINMPMSLRTLVALVPNM